MKKLKIVLTQSIVDELADIIKNGSMLEYEGKRMRTRAENILSSYATYGIEMPSKRKTRLIKENKKSVTWLPDN